MANPIRVLYHVVDRPEFNRMIDSDKMNAFAENTTTFVKELQAESDRGALLMAADYISEALRQLLEARMIPLSRSLRDGLFEDSHGPLKPLSARAKLALALG